MPLQYGTEEQFHQTFDVNVKDTFFTVQKLLTSDDSSYITGIELAV